MYQVVSMEEMFPGNTSLSSATQIKFLIGPKKKISLKILYDYTRKIKTFSPEVGVF